MLALLQRMTYFEIFTTGNADCLVMKKKSAIGQLPKPGFESRPGLLNFFGLFFPSV
jgi:hypothetical protein